MIPRLRPHIGISELAALCLPAEEGLVVSFERAFADLMQQKHAVSFPYGRTGLVCLLQALGIRGKEIICPAWTCVVVPHAVVQSGNEPVFVDCSEYDFNMSIAAAEQEVSPETGAIIPTSLFGQPVDLEALDAFRERKASAVVIQDCAHSFAAEWRGRQVQKQGIASLFGLGVGKLITAILGGMVTTDDDSLANELRRVREITTQSAGPLAPLKKRIYFLAANAALSPAFYGMVNLLERKGGLNRYVKYYDEQVIRLPDDWRKAFTGLQAAVGLKQIARYPQIVETRRRAAALYTQLLAGLPGIVLPPWQDGATWSHYTIRVNDRDALLRYALKRGIQLGWLIEYCIPDMAAYRQRPGYRDCPVARQFAREAVNLPVWSDKLPPKVCSVLEDYLTETYA